MDNNFNIQQNNMQQQSIYQQIPQTSMMNFDNKKKKSKKGLIIGLLTGLFLVIGVIALIIVFWDSEEGSLEGTWVGKDGTKVVFEDDLTKDGLLRYEITLNGENVDAIVTKYGKKLRFLMKAWNDEEMAFDYEFRDAEIKKLTNKKLVLKYDGKEYTLKRK